MSRDADFSGVHSASAPRRVLHIITGLGTGGAETSLLELVRATASRGVQHDVVALTGPGALSEPLQLAGATVTHLGLSRGRISWRAFAALREHARATAPDVVHGWMYHGNLAASALGAHAGRSLVWSVRHALDAWTDESRTRRAIIRASAFASTRPQRIVYNSARSAAQHASLGFSSRHAEVIPNGIDLARFRPDAEARARVRAELGVDERTLLIGLVARVDPLKDHRAFLEAASQMAARDSRVQFVLAGRGTDATTGEFADLVASMSLGARLHRLGERRDVAAVFAACDLATLTSRSEGFPNVVAEAMACGIACVVTDVGDAAEVVESREFVVPPRAPTQLAAAWAAWFDRTPAERAAVAERARTRVADRFSLSACASRYLALWQNLSESQAA